MNMQQVKSSNIQAVGYDEETKTLQVQFMGSGLYRYYGVAPELHKELMESESKGKFMNAKIKGHRYEKVVVKKEDAAA